MEIQRAYSYRITENFRIRVKSSPEMIVALETVQLAAAMATIWLQIKRLLHWDYNQVK